MQNQIKTSIGNKIEGTKIASEILSELKPEVKSLNKNGITPTLAIIQIGEDESSNAYIKQKKLKAEEIGVKIKLFHYNSTTQEELEDTIARLNEEKDIHGIIVQRPLSKGFDSEEISKLINVEKDVDGFNDNSNFDAPVAVAVLKILSSVNITDIKKKKIVVIGKGETAGGPIIKLFDKKGLKFSAIDSKTTKNEEQIKNSDIIISAVGKKNIIKGEWLSRNQTLIGVGLSLVDGKLIGDYVEDEVKNNVKFYTPRIGGVGPVNIALLMKNVIMAAKTLSSN